MIADYIQAALSAARYEKLDDRRNPYYGEVPVLKGVWASGRTLEQCRERLAEVVEGWLIVRLRNGLNIPRIGKARVTSAKALRFGT